MIPAQETVHDKQGQSSSSFYPFESPDYQGFGFEIKARDADSFARCGVYTTPHGCFETPNFIFCATKAAMKNLSPRQMTEAGSDIILANTYHLMLRPGSQLIHKMGGLRKFMSWDGPMMTDSGGFQIFSMKHGGQVNEVNGRQSYKRDKTLLDIDENGASFRSYIDGQIFHLSPESSVRIQSELGADIIMQFDELTASTDDRDYTARSMQRSIRWGDRSLVALRRQDRAGQNLPNQAMYGIIQGGVYPEFRIESIQQTLERPYFGTAFGGCFGETLEQFYELLEATSKHFQSGRPVHLLGFGGIRNIFRCVRHGVDTFDCVSPTRIARHGWALMKGVKSEKINLRNARFAGDPEPLDPDSDLESSQNYSKGYIHHLLRSDELLASQILSQHNVYMMTRLMKEIRQAISTGTLDNLEMEWCVD